MHLKKFVDMLDECYVYVDYKEGIRLGTMEYTKYKENDNTVVELSPGPDGDLNCKVEFIFDGKGTFLEHRVERY